MSAILKEQIGFGGTLESTSSLKSPSKKNIQLIDPENGNRVLPLKVTSQSIKKSRDMLDNFEKKISNFPKYISYDGAVVLCVSLSLKEHYENTYVNLSGLPIDDQQRIKFLLPFGFLSPEHPGNFLVKFDEAKDFIVTFTAYPKKVKFEDINEFEITLLNSIIRQNIDKDIPRESEFSIKKEGDTIKVGNVIQIREDLIQKATSSSNIPKPSTTEHKSEMKPIGFSKNAFEIRADVLRMAIDCSKYSDGHNDHADKVIGIAKKFYSFVQQRDYK